MHTEILIREWGMRDCRTMDTPMNKEAAEELNGGEELIDDEARRIRRATAPIMAQDHPDLSG